MRFSRVFGGMEGAGHILDTHVIQPRYIFLIDFDALS